MKAETIWIYVQSIPFVMQFREHDEIFRASIGNFKPWEQLCLDGQT
jgi:hypothetical protein